MAADMTKRVPQLDLSYWAMNFSSASYSFAYSIQGVVPFPGFYCRLGAVQGDILDLTYEVIIYHLWEEVVYDLVAPQCIAYAEKYCPELSPSFPTCLLLCTKKLSYYYEENGYFIPP